ncbi:unnamed protein product [Nezara viridula]|uniref:MD-2-related lipid-recognition domain-containing protein n=1 Tax=Nezara viridula TaxID=85310 RepID=A0A9P0HPH6_NEZVI|nr:unnamed protein product [Nezara viridula]
MVALNLWKCLIVFILIILHCYADYSNKAGPYDVIFRQIDECTNAGTREVVMNAKIKKLDRETTAIDGNMTLKTPFNDDITSILKLSQFTNGGYKENSYTQVVKKSCNTILNLLPVMTKEIWKAGNIGKGCPIKPGTYNIYNYTTKEQINIVPIFFYNKYKAEIIYNKFGKRVGCIEIYAEIVPKRQHSGRGGLGQRKRS